MSNAVEGEWLPKLQRRRVLQQLQQSLRVHSVFVVLVAVYVGLGWLTSQVASTPVPYAPDLYSTSLLFLTAGFLVVAATAYIAYVMAVIRPKQLIRYLGRALRDRILTLDRLWIGLPVFLLLPVVMSTFTYLKFMIPHLHPFDLDPVFAEWDRLLHFGRQPWELLQPALGRPAVSAVINFIYHLWLFVMFGVILWQAFSLSRPRLRMRYLITFVLMWGLLGNVSATLLSSTGPVYFGRVTGLDDPFAPLMTYLHQASQTVWLPALEVQEMLWDSYITGNLDLGRGISAMPSLHVATSFSFALLGFAINRWLGMLFSVFAGAILIGSVHLGWHYAIDGYVALIATWVVWRLVGWLLDRPSVVRLLWGSAPPAR
jgi:PAP2 superfamily